MKALAVYVCVGLFVTGYAINEYPRLRECVKDYGCALIPIGVWPLVAGQLAWDALGRSTTDNE